MVRPPSSPSNKESIKFMCSYGGKIVPRHADAKLRYHGGHTRVLAVPRSISFSELMTKMGELCNAPVILRCQLPTEDLDALVSIKSDEDLINLIEEYDRLTSSNMKIRAFLSPLRPTTNSKSPSPPSSEYGATLSPSPKSQSPKSLSPSSSFSAIGSSPRFVPVAVPMVVPPASYGGKVAQPKSHFGCHHFHRSSSHVYLIHNGNHWH